MMGIKFIKKVTCIILFGYVSVAMGADMQSKLWEELLQHRIELRQFLTYRGYLHYYPERLRSIYPDVQDFGYAVCGTELNSMIRANWDILAPEEQELFAPMIEGRDMPQLDYELITPSGFFKIHYSTTGSDAVLRQT